MISFWRRWWGWWRQQRQYHEDIVTVCVGVVLALLYVCWSAQKSLGRWIWSMPDHAVKVLESVFYVVSIIAVVIAVAQFVQRAQFQRRHEKYETYVELNNRYWDFVALLIAHPLLVSDEQGTRVPSVSPADEYRQRQIVDYFFCLAEEAFVLQELMPKKQWNAWDAYIRIRTAIPEFRAYWFAGDAFRSNTLDRDFEKYMRAILEQPERTPIS